MSNTQVEKLAYTIGDENTVNINEEQNKLNNLDKNYNTYFDQKHMEQSFQFHFFEILALYAAIMTKLINELSVLNCNVSASDNMIEKVYKYGDCTMKLIASNYDYPIAVGITLFMIGLACYIVDITE
jgi:hypothetical protein